MHIAKSLVVLLFVVNCGAYLAPPVSADEQIDRIQAFTKKYCVECHNAQRPRGELDLGRFAEAKDITGDFRRWSKVVELVRHGEMPPEDFERQPALAERNEVISAVEAILLAEAKKTAGDPGVILPRRLSHTEFDLSVRDLTGVDIRPTKDFPADPAGGEGFDNTGEALTMSPNLLKKYLEAAEQVADHLVLKTNGIAFAPFPVNSYNERKKLTEQAIIDFYRRHDVRIADYLTAAWRYRYRPEAERDVTIEAWAERSRLSGRYLRLVWDTLQDAPNSSGYMREIGALWQAVPAPAEGAEIPAALTALDKQIAHCRRLLGAREEALIRSNAGNWPISHLDFRARTAERRDHFDPDLLKSKRLLAWERVNLPPNNEKPPKDVSYFLRIHTAFKGGGDSIALFHRPVFTKGNQPPKNAEETTKQEAITLRAFLERHAPALAERLKFGVHPAGLPLDADSFAVRAPELIEWPITGEMLRELDGKKLLVECELDPERSAEGCVQIQHGIGPPPAELSAGDVDWLVHPHSRMAAELTASSEIFCRAFPNRFAYVDNERGLAAGFHLVEGFFRDDLPLVRKVLNDEQNKQLDGLWDELHFVTQSAETLLRGFVWFERAERHVLHDQRFDFLRAEDPKLVEEELLSKFERVYLEKNGVKLAEDAPLRPIDKNDRFELIHDFFERIRTDLARHRERMQTAERAALDQLGGLATRAYHRPLRQDEDAALRALYAKLRGQGQSVEDSLRNVFTAILLSPDFCFRLAAPPPGAGVVPLSNDELAGRLSYFLWSSLPDEELLQAARDGRLQDEAALAAQARRMCRSPKIEAFAREFFGQWLRYRDYLAKDPINAADFPGYGDAVRTAMFDEPTKLIVYLVHQDRPITDLLNSDITFVNAPLAKHYGGRIEERYRKLAAEQTGGEPSRGSPAAVDPDDGWLQIDGLRSAGRGGLFGMGVILAKNSAGGRTSPIKRGFWTVHHLLGQHFPPPPADVPELPKSEKESKRTIRELIVEHTANPRCAMCHTHFDSLGMALEGFDPIGRARTKDLAGRPIDDLVKLPNGKTSQGVPGLIEFVESHRRKDFVKTLCRKFLGYALGRSVELSDQLLLNEMESDLERNDYRFSTLFETVVRSPQFRNQRGRDFKSAAR